MRACWDVWLVCRPILHRFANEDVSLGAWLIGLEVEHVDDRSMCCATPPGGFMKLRFPNSLADLARYDVAVTVTASLLDASISLQIASGRSEPGTCAWRPSTGRAAASASRWTGCGTSTRRAAKAKGPSGTPPPCDHRSSPISSFGTYPSCSIYWELHLRGAQFLFGKWEGEGRA